MDVGLDIVDGNTGGLRDLTGDRQGGSREVQAGHPRPESGQRDRVGSDVALQMHTAKTGDGAQTGHVEPHDLGKPVGVGDQLMHRVVRGGGVRGGTFVPQRPVDVTVFVVHTDTVAGIARTRGATGCTSTVHLQILENTIHISVFFVL
jgi:hypothetical protein